MDYRNFDTDDFIADEGFIDWVKNPDEEKTAYWSEILKQHPEKEKKIIDARNFITGLLLETDALPNEEKLKLLDSLHTNSKKTERPEPTISWSKPLISVAALVLVLFTFFQFFSSPSNLDFQTQVGEIQTVILPDGSTVHLNARSQLTYSSDWGTSTDREVWLKGEAYFDVKKSGVETKRKFTVHTGEIDVQVLGTKFSINAHEPSVQVVLEEGKVEVLTPIYKKTAGTQEVEIQFQSSILAPGERAVFTAENDHEQLQGEKVNFEVKVEEVNTKIYTSWKDGRFFFDSTPLSELKQIFKDNYGIEVSFEDPKLMDKRISGSLENGDLDLLCRAIESVFDLQIERSNKKFTIRE